MRTISRSKRTVVVSVSCGKTGCTQRHRDTKTQRRAIKDLFSRASVSLCLCVFVLFRRRHIESKHESVNLLVSPKLRPGTIPTRFGHQPFESYIGTASQLLETGARRNYELRSR